MMSHRSRLLLVAALFVALLTGLRFGWLHLFGTPEHPQAVGGVLDLRDWDFERNRTITLDGEWEFYPGVFVQPGEAGALLTLPRTPIHVPGDWRAAMPDSSPYGFGTYRLRIRVGGGLEQPYGVWVERARASSILLVNGQKLAQFGQPASEREQYTPKAHSYIVSYSAADEREIELIMHVANYDDPRSGGIVRSMRFGSQAAVDTERMYSIGFQFIMFVILLLHALYAAIVLLFNRNRAMIGTLILLLVFAALSVSVSDDMLLMFWLPIPYMWAQRLSILAYVGLAYLMMRMMCQLFPEHGVSRLLLRGYGGFAWVYALCVMFAPAQLVFPATWLFTLAVVSPVVAINIIMIKMLLRNVQDAVFLLLATASVLSSILWGSLTARGYADFRFYPIDMLSAVIGFSAFWLRRYFRNVEHNARLTEQLKRADKLKDEFLANTSHELRTPLHGIMNIAQAVAAAERETMKPNNLKDLELLVTISRRMSHMLNDLLDLSQLKENRIVLRPEPLRVQAVATGVIDMMRFMAEGKPLRLVMAIAPTFPPVEADEKRLVQILSNLLHNAIKFTHEGTIAISAEAKGGRGFIHVADSGIGMDEETQTRAFRPYEQGAPGIMAGGGIGLGLSICKQLAELHGGRLSVRSVPGEGSVFTLELPLAVKAKDAEGGDSPAVPAAAATAMFAGQAGAYSTGGRASANERSGERAAGGASASGFASGKESGRAAAGDGARSGACERTNSLGLGNANGNATGETTVSEHAKILAVDDDPVNLKVLCNILSSERYDITTAISGKEAMSLLEADTWDLIVTDVMMAHMSGYELARLVRERFSVSELPILLLTARNQPEDIYTGFLSGANDYVTKPVDAMELKYRVRALIELKQSVGDRLRMEAAYLQAQIQPHFLFNTLNSITALGDIDTVKMNGLVEAFSTYLRISFDFWNSKRLVPLEHELELVRAYLHIEKERFEERLNVVWHLAPHHGLRLPPLTIQPLVENAVKHGILSRVEGGTVYIRLADGDEEHWSIEVADDGAGMDEETARALLKEERPSGKGIGVHNTHRRLKQQYGHGLSIQSRLGEGTSITFRVPKSRRGR